MCVEFTPEETFLLPCNFSQLKNLTVRLGLPRSIKIWATRTSRWIGKPDEMDADLSPGPARDKAERKT